MQKGILCQSRFYMREKESAYKFVIVRPLLYREQRILRNYPVFH